MKQLLVFLLLLCSASVSAQDVIVKKDGSTIVCRVVEVTSTEITYKKWGDLNGSNYVMDKSLASAINYENGKKVNLSEATNLYMPNNQNDGVQQYNDRALLALDAAQNRDPLKGMKTRNALRWSGGVILAALGITFTIMSFAGDFVDWETGHYENGQYVRDEIEYNTTGQWLCRGTAIVCDGGAIWLLSSAVKHQKAIKQLQQDVSLYQHNIPFSNGSSLSLGADLLRDNMFGQNTIGLGLRYNF